MLKAITCNLLLASAAALVHVSSCDLCRCSSACRRCASASFSAIWLVKESNSCCPDVCREQPQ